MLRLDSHVPLRDYNFYNSQILVLRSSAISGLCFNIKPHYLHEGNPNAYRQLSGRFIWRGTGPRVNAFITSGHSLQLLTVPFSPYMSKVCYLFFLSHLVLVFKSQVIFCVYLPRGHGSPHSVEIHPCYELQPVNQDFDENIIRRNKKILMSKQNWCRITSQPSM